jgi:LuxR family maltose regulon positive regulatory protein
MDTLLLTTKLHVPPVRPDLVSRPRLMKRLDEGLDRALTLVSAAAGFGKTTLIAEWLGGIQRPFAWLSLDEGDNDPIRFVTHLVGALQQVDESIGQDALNLLGSPQSPRVQTVATLLVNDIAAVPESFVLVLDDYHLIHADSIHEGTAFLLDHQPGQLHLVLVTRQDPPLPLPRFRVRGQMLEVGEEDLRFTADEAGAFLTTSVRQDMDSHIVHALEARTEGWIAGLKLAALSVQGRSPQHTAAFVEAFSGSHRHVIDYLAGEVLAQQSAEIRDFLCHTSILDRFTAPLCDALTGRSDSREMLKQLEDANLFLIPLDDQRRWYRYHHLFADFLRTELDAQTMASLHTTASNWLEAHDLLPDAVKHALAAEDVEQAARVVGLACDEALRSGSIATMQAWLDALPQDLLRSHSDLATFKGLTLFFTGHLDEVSDFAGAAAASLPDDATRSARGRLLSLQAHVALCTDPPHTTASVAREALEWLGADDVVYRSLVLNILGQVLELQGDLRAAIEVYRETVRGKQRAGDQVGALVVRTNLVFALNELGRRREAVDVCQEVIEEGSPSAGQNSIMAQGINLAWSLLSYEANELEQARDQVTRALSHADRVNITDGILWARLILCRIQLAPGELDAARKLARDSRQYAANLDVYDVKVRWFAALEAESWLLAGELHRVGRWLEESQFSPIDAPHHWDELPYLTYVRLLLAQGQLDDAQTALAGMERAAEAGSRQRKLITIYLLQALAHLARGRSQEPLDLVEKALRLAAPEDYLRAVLDEGPRIIDLVRRVRHRSPDFVDRVLAASSPQIASQPAGGMVGLIEPLSERELQVLRLMAAGRSNPEIADLLYLSLNTIKWHAKNLYGKLNVSSRMAAVSRARELELL